jgi:hypothetical protein
MRSRRWQAAWPIAVLSAVATGTSTAAQWPAAPSWIQLVLVLCAAATTGLVVNSTSKKTLPLSHLGDAHP